MIRKHATHQEFWDMLLLEGWKMDHKMSYIVSDFIRYRGVEVEGSVIESLANIKRAPRDAGAIKSPVKAYIAQTLPKISAMLWADCTYEQVMPHLVITKAKLRSTSQRDYHSSSENKMMHEQRKSRGIRFVDMHAGHRRSDWEKVK